MRSLFKGVILLAAGVLLTQSGCAVPQKPGHGKQMQLVEPETRTTYWLYLPEEYVKNNGQHAKGERWPLVVTLHGLRPYDNAVWQNREWQEEADRYGFIVLAPDLRTCDSLTMQFPLHDPTLSYVKEDERAILAIMDDVFRRTNADPTRVLVTSFSSGGYLAHFMANQHPERFTVLAVRGSNFNRDLLSPAQISKYRHMPIGIFFGQNDLPVCRTESMEAIEWYRQHRFHVEAKMVNGMGHERRPQVAAAYFARAVGVSPKTPPDLGGLVVMDIPGQESSATPPRPLPKPILPTTPPPDLAASSTLPSATGGRKATVPVREKPPAGGELIFSGSDAVSGAASSRQPRQVEPTRPTARPLPSVNTNSRSTATPKRPIRQPYDTAGEGLPEHPEGLPSPATLPSRGKTLDLNLSAAISVKGNSVGQAPFWIDLSAVIPAAMREGASILWTDNGVPVGSGSFQTQAVLREPGAHHIAAHIFTSDDRQITAMKTVQVLPPDSPPARP